MKGDHLQGCLGRQLLAETDNLVFPSPKPPFNGFPFKIMILATWTNWKKLPQVNPSEDVGDSFARASAKRTSSKPYGFNPSHIRN